MGQCERERAKPPRRTAPSLPDLEETGAFLHVAARREAAEFFFEILGEC
jgi:hypothetical protein